MMVKLYKLDTVESEVTHFLEVQIILLNTFDSNFVIAKNTKSDQH